MNIPNTLVLFTQQIVEAASNNDALANVAIHSDVYEEIKPGKTIRIDDLRSAELAVVPSPSLVSGLAVRKDNAVLNVQFIAMPETQNLNDRLQARQITEDMADAWYLNVFENLELQALICRVGKTIQFNDWIKPGNSKMPVCVLRLLINPEITR